MLCKYFCLRLKKIKFLIEAQIEKCWIYASFVFGTSVTPKSFCLNFGLLIYDWYKYVKCLAFVLAEVNPEKPLLRYQVPVFLSFAAHVYKKFKKEYLYVSLFDIVFWAHIFKVKVCLELEIFLLQLLGINLQYYQT